MAVSIIQSSQGIPVPTTQGTGVTKIRTQRAEIMATAFRNHAGDSPALLVHEIVEDTHRTGTPLTEPTVEAGILQFKGIDNPSEVPELIGLLKEIADRKLDLQKLCDEFLHLGGIIAVGVAQFDPHNPGLKDLILRTINNMRESNYLQTTQDTEQSGVRVSCLERYVGALLLIDNLAAEAIIIEFSLDTRDVTYFAHEFKKP